jgi:mitogen-activated protein kinase organizer 1
VEVSVTLSLNFLKRYKGHKNKEFKILSTFSNDDAFVVSGSEDGDIWFWGLEEVFFFAKQRIETK